jgi:Fe2+ or Zn2+ uptake regulation protein
MQLQLNANARAILEVVQSANNHPTALEVYAAVRSVRPRIGLATVYRVLHQLSEQGHIKELGQHVEGVRYDANTRRHDHAVCTDCGVLLDVPLAIDLPAETLQAAARSSTIELGTYEIRLYGRCESCQKRSNKI